MKPKPLQSFLDDPKLIRKHRKALARRDRDRMKLRRELEDAQRLGPADFAIRFNCRDTLLCALLAALLASCSAVPRDPPAIATRTATGQAPRLSDYADAYAARATLFHRGSTIKSLVP